MVRDKRLTIAFSHLLLLLFSVLTGYPLVWMVFSSLKNEGEFYINLWSFPRKWIWENYAKAWEIAHLATTYKNSVIVTGTSILIILLISYLAAYALARFQFPGSKIVMGLYLSALMIPSQVSIIPLFKVELFFHIYNTRWGLILPYVAGGMIFSIFLLTSFIRALPQELEESAEMDGSSQLGILWRIIFPLTKAGLATIIILSFIGIWNEFFLALVMIKDPVLHTIPIGMVSFTATFTETNYGQVFAALSITILPIIAIYVFFQRFFISGVTQGALKL